MALHIEAIIRHGSNMNINDKISMVELKIQYYENALKGNIAILEEDFDSLSEGDEEVVLLVIDNITNIINALKNEKQALTNQVEMI